MPIRQNLPLYGVGALLLVLLAVAVVLGQRQRAGMPEAMVALDGTQAGAPPAALPPELAALPATAEDDAVITSQLAMDDARTQNAGVPIVVSRLKPAPPFRFRGSEVDRQRARECLALAGMAEAGAGDEDQRAVMQVILNRTRHPAFANSVCGVVFQGSERSTGCQFTFTCDGSLSRRYPEAMWRAARQRADEMLGGAVYAPVGNATHYHTNWVYPWWSPKLDKIAQVKTHLFFRWRGFWGTHAALSARYSGGEPNPAVLRLSANAVDRSELELVAAPEGEELEGVVAGDAPVPLTADYRSPAPGVYFLLVDPDVRPAALRTRAEALCTGGGFCQVYGWSSAAAMPAALPLSAEARRMLRFSFVPGRGGRSATLFYDCRLFPAAPPGTCLPAAPNPGTAAIPAASRPSAQPAQPRPLPSAPSKLPEAGTLKADAEVGTLCE